MKKQHFLTSTMAAALTALSGCSSGDEWNEDVVASEDTAICVDQNGNRIDDDNCNNNRTRFGGYYGTRYYINRGARIPYLGDSIRDTRYNFQGSTQPRPGASYFSAPSSSNVTRSTAIARGGFGSSLRSFGGGRS
jgi:hypothetical protein